MQRPLAQRAVSEALSTALLLAAVVAGPAAHTPPALKPLAAFLDRASAGPTPNERV